MDVKQQRFDRSTARLLAAVGACAMVALGLLGIHSAETHSGAATTTARHSVSRAVTP
ncbi:hypothetical protein [Mycolicibacterium sp. YH-1]|uniref:hypothetical protein n=1 Tax=Mycolicibacterium sp. YH-1 TaxID=2908837 RepID=UPI001F4C3DEA|nr:hypothetical protein [Mycolicibacterium sp. YH-1]UNB51983.1 hypothetical protein L0M16_29585 [Mycolicibacterium sp. YH-1]